jgi:hypothetical protein
LSWIEQVQDFARHLVLAEGIDYFMFGLQDRAFPKPSEAKHIELKSAMFDATADFSIGELIYLSWKPLQEAADAYRRNTGMPVDAATSHAVNQFAKRAPTHRANGWKPKIYQQPPSLPIALVTTQLFGVLGKQTMTDHVVDLIDAAHQRMDAASAQAVAGWESEERLLQAGPLPDGAWDEVLQALDAEALADREPGRAPWPDDGFFSTWDAVQSELVTSIAGYLRDADERTPDDRAQLLADSHAGAPLAAYTIVRQLAKSDDNRVDVDLAIAIAGGVQSSLVEANRRRLTTPTANRTDQS